MLVLASETADVLFFLWLEHVDQETPSPGAFCVTHRLRYSQETRTQVPQGEQQRRLGKM